MANGSSGRGSGISKRTGQSTGAGAATNADEDVESTAEAFSDPEESEPAAVKPDLSRADPSDSVAPPPVAAKSTTAKATTAKATTAKATAAKAAASKAADPRADGARPAAKSTSKSAPTKASTSKASTSKASTSKASTSKAGASKASTSKAGASRPTGSKSAGKSVGKAAPRSRGRKPPPVVLAKPKPWGWIAAAVAVVVFAVAAIGYAVLQANETAALADPNNIEGIQTKSFVSQQHINQNVDYPDSPPFGGEHDPAWADCSGTVYPSQIRNENVLHSLEHGAVWISYNPDLPEPDVEKLASLVVDQDFMLMSPYAGLESPISLQSWGNQLFVDSPDDPRIEQFITALRQNPSTAPEPGASCDNPAFLADPLPEESPGAPDPSAPAPTDATASTDPAATTAP